MFIVYCAEAENGKKYIGYTNKSLEVRKKQHLRDAKKKKYDIKFHRALNKHDFSWKILAKYKTKSEARKQEIAFIKSFDSRNNGYNSTFGGDGFSGDRESKHKISKTLKRYHKNLGARLKHSKKRGGRPFHVFKKTGEYVGKFLTQIDCCEKLKLQKSKVCLALQGKIKSHKGYIFSHKKEFKPNFVKPKVKLIAFCCKTNKKLNTYESISECAKSLGITREQVSHSLYGKLKTKPTHNYRFERTL